MDYAGFISTKPDPLTSSRSNDLRPDSPAQMPNSVRLVSKFDLTVTKEITTVDTLLDPGWIYVLHCSLGKRPNACPSAKRE